VVAKKALDEATLANARLDFERDTRLAASNSIAQQQLDTQRALVAQLEAQVRLDQAAIDNAKTILNYTSVVAPISGRTGIRLVDQGNIVRAANSTGIVVITQLQPISLFFTLPQQQLGDVNRAFAKGPLQVDAFGPDNKTVVETGELKVVDNQVDPSTGTIKLKAEFANRELQLWPGAFINVRLLINTLKQVVVAPTAAIQRGPNGTFVYVVAQDNKVAVRPVTVAQQDEVQAVVAKGLEADERVVTTGFARLTTGAAVTVTNAESAPSPDAQQPQRQRRRGGAQGQQRSEAGSSTRQ
jgi:multidrug efflux system membrane fusion protein